MLKITPARSRRTNLQLFPPLLSPHQLLLRFFFFFVSRFDSMFAFCYTWVYASERASEQASEWTSESIQATIQGEKPLSLPNAIIVKSYVQKADRPNCIVTVFRLTEPRNLHKHTPHRGMAWHGKSDRFSLHLPPLLVWIDGFCGFLWIHFNFKFGKRANRAHNLIFKFWW